MHWRHNLRPPHRAWKSLGLLAVAFAVGACNSTSGPDVPQGISAVSGNDQYAAVGSAASNPLVVLVVDPSGTPFSGATVSWTVTGGGGSVSDSTSTSDASGHAAMTYTAGATPGVATVVATVAQVWTTSFTVYVEAPSSAVARVR